MGLLEVLMDPWREGQNGSGVWDFFQTCNKTKKNINHLPVVDFPQCWGMVSWSWWCLSDLSTLMQGRWQRIVFSAFQNSFSLPLWSPLSVFIWPVYTRLCPHSCKHLLWLDGAVWALQWTTVCHCCKLNESWNVHILRETDIWCYRICELIQIIGTSFKNTPVSAVEAGL